MTFPSLNLFELASRQTVLAAYMAWFGLMSAMYKIINGQEMHPVICMRCEEFVPPPPGQASCCRSWHPLANPEWMNENNVIALVMTTVAHINSFILLKYRHHFLAGKANKTPYFSSPANEKRLPPPETAPPGLFLHNLEYSFMPWGSILSLFPWLFSAF